MTFLATGCAWWKIVRLIISLSFPLCRLAEPSAKSLSSSSLHFECTGGGEVAFSADVVSGDNSLGLGVV